jgi:hypothetical protein
MCDDVMMNMMQVHIKIFTPDHFILQYQSIIRVSYHNKTTNSQQDGEAQEYNKIIK